MYVYGSSKWRSIIRIIPPVVRKPLIFFRDCNQITTIRMINLIFVLLTNCRQHLVYSMDFAQIFFYLIDMSWILYVNVSYLMIDHSEGFAVFEVDEFVTAYLPNV